MSVALESERLSQQANPVALRGVNLEKRFGGLRAVKDLSIEVPAGEITGLIGPNGSGKTTSLNLLSGALKCDRGQVLLGDRDITKSSIHARARRGLARTFQRMLLFKQMAALENVLTAAELAAGGSLALDYLGLPGGRRRARAARERAVSLLERIGLDPGDRTPVGLLSYGTQRKVEIARAVATNPRVLLVDEPTAGMDEHEALEIAGFLREIASGGAGVLLVEHNVELVKEFCEAVTVLDAGNVIARGQARSVMRSEAVVAAYLGHSV